MPLWENFVAAIDVLLPVRNGLPFLGEAIDSILNQTFSDWRLLVLDHGSSDGSLEVAQKYEDRDTRIEVYSLPEAHGLAGLLNAGLERCDCEFVLRQDADDISVPARMSLVDDVFRARPDLDLIGSGAILIDETGRQLGYLPRPTSPRAVAAATFFYNPFLHSTITARLATFKRYGAPYGKNILEVVPEADFIAMPVLVEDYSLFGQLALLGHCANLDYPLIKYRRHIASVGGSSPVRQIELALQVSCFLAKSLCLMRSVPEFDPRPFSNHSEYVCDFHLSDYAVAFEQMAVALRHGLGRSKELERELAFRWSLATRKSAQMGARYVKFRMKYAAMPSEWRTVRNWLLRGARKGRYVYRAEAETVLQGNSISANDGNTGAQVQADGL
jgi:glycosyltransferase involved in cell wall biosynthesis